MTPVAIQPKERMSQVWISVCRRFKSFLPYLCWWLVGHFNEHGSMAGVKMSGNVQWMSCNLFDCQEKIHGKEEWKIHDNLCPYRCQNILKSRSTDRRCCSNLVLYSTGCREFLFPIPPMLFAQVRRESLSCIYTKKGHTYNTGEGWIDMARNKQWSC